MWIILVGIYSPAELLSININVPIQNFSFISKLSNFLRDVATVTIIYVDSLQAKGTSDNNFDDFVRYESKYFIKLMLEDCTSS
jgi:O-phosphoseryl-tRNA(Cys) synthetase